MIFSQVIFWGFSTLLIGSAVMTVSSRQPIHSALWLVLAFFSASVLWLSLQAEFLGLVLILVYVGAVMILFLFAVMTLPHQMPVKGFQYQKLLAAATVAIWLGLILYSLSNSPVECVSASSQLINKQTVTQVVNNAQALGIQLYTTYVYPLELAGILLLIAIISAITLTNEKRRADSKIVAKQQQLAVRRAQRIKLVKIQAVKK